MTKVMRELYWICSNESIWREKNNVCFF